MIAVFGLLAALVFPPGVAGQVDTAPVLENARRLIEAFDFDQVVTFLDEAIQTMTTSPDSDLDSLAQAYELRAQAHFNLDHPDLAELDFERVLEVRADHGLTPDLSPRIVELFEEVKARLLGALLLSTAQPGTVTIDGRAYEVGTEAVIPLMQGRHEFAIRQAGYREDVRNIDIIPGVPTMLTVSMERITGTLSVVTIPGGVRVLVDDVPRGITEPGSGAASAPLVVDGIVPGRHLLRLERDCFVSFDTSFTMASPPDDQNSAPLELAPAVATASVGTIVGDAMVYLDGEPYGPAPAEMADLCEGPHVIEVRGPRGRFVDRRVWAAGATAALDADLRPAFALVEVAGSPDPAATAELTTRVEEALAATTDVRLFSPTTDEVVAAAGDPRLDVALSSDDATLTRRRDMAGAWSERLNTQGVAWLVPVADQADTYDLFLLASASGQPDVIRLDMDDVGSRAAAQRQLDAPPPPIVRTTLQTVVVDVAGIDGAAVIQVDPGGAGETAGLAPGDIIVGAAGAPVTSVSGLSEGLARAEPNAELALDVRGQDGVVRSASILVGLEPDTIPLADPNLLYNKILLDLETRALAERGGVTGAAASLNLAIAHMRLGSWDHAMVALEATSLPVGPGVSAATVDYLLALCLREIGDIDAAGAALRRAADADGALLSVGGPPIGPLAARALDTLPGGF